MTYIVVSSNEIVKSEMAVPDCWGWSGPNPMGCKKCIKFQAHCLSLPRIPIKGKHNWKVWQEVPESEIRWQYQYCKQDNIYRWFNCEKIDYIGWPKHLRRIVAIPIQPTPEGEKAEEKDLIIQGLEEGSELWKAEYDNCRVILTELVYLKTLKDAKGKTDEYEQRQPLAWVAAKKFLEKYQHH